MTKKRNIGGEIIEGLEDSIKHMRGQKTRAHVAKKVATYLFLKSFLKKFAGKIGNFFN